MKPKLSFILPVLNAEKFLVPCLASIRRQNYPSTDYEILVADGGSRDRTLEIALFYGAKIIDATGLLAEPAKQLAFQQAQGDYLAMIDADNELVGADWLSRSLAALGRYPDALGFESYYLKAPGDSQLNHYLTGLLQISDPCAQMMAGKLQLLERLVDGTELWSLPPDGSYPTGANGFIFAKKHLANLPAGTPYHEASFFPTLIKQGRRSLVKIAGVGVYHHYVTSWSDYYRKRRRAMIIYKLRREQIQETWDCGQAAQWRTLRTVFYFGTFFGPFVEALWRFIRTGDRDWLLHPLAGLVSVAGNMSGILAYYRQGTEERRKRATVIHAGGQKF